MNSTPTVSTTPQSATKQRGFTLIELVIAMVIAAILASLAIPAYSSYVRKSHRTEAKTTLLDMASLEERFFSTQNSYTNQPVNLGFGSVNLPLTVGSGYYQITDITVVAATAPTALVPAGVPATYSLTATAIGDQAKDLCSTLTLTSAGVQTATGSDPSPNVNCWK